jgi:hypothetical protein
VLKGALTTEQARVKLGMDAPAAPEPEVTVPIQAPAGVDAKTIAKAVRAAVRPLHKEIAGQDRAIRRLRKETERIAAQPDTTNAPFRGAALTKSATSAAPAGPLTVADTVEQAKATRIKLLEDQWRNDPNPALREAAYQGLRQELDMHIPPTPMRT